MKILATILLLAATNYAHASVNKCVDAKGKITFTDAVCKPTQKASTVKISPINIGNSDKQALYELEEQQRNKRITYRSEPPIEKDSITKGNEERMRRWDSPLPNGLGTGKSCHLENRQYYCY